MSRWLSNCVQNHPECHPRNLDPWFPTRLIDLGPPSSPCVPHLIITEEYATFQSYKGLADMEFANLPVYATLSHCWGKVQPLKLLSSNIQEMKEEIPLISIPKTFTDAFLVAKSLQIRYIWIDSLCIIQDSRADWKKESAMMGRVYGMSYCSIAGTGAIDNSEGLFPRENSIKPEPTGLVIRWDSVPERRYVIVEVADAWRAQFEKLPLNQRAWALQERILANRILHFTKDQLIWECREHVASEEFPTGLPDSLQESHRTRNKLLYSSKSEFPHAWADIIRMYTQAELTFPLDKLIAISGLASEARSRKCVSGRYIAGMWECQLPMSLLWVRGDMHENAYACRRPKQYRAPFWSWASLDCPIDLKWTTAHVLRQSNLTEVKHVHAGSAEYEFNGQAVETFISLCGPLGLFTWKQKSRWHGRGKEIKSYCIATVKNFPVPEQPPMIASTTFPDSVWNDVIFDALEEDHLSDLLWCLPVYLCYGDDAVDSGGPEPRAYGLILDQVKEDHFRRVGAFRICSPDVEALAHLSLHTIVLV